MKIIGTSIVVLLFVCFQFARCKNGIDSGPQKDAQDPIEIYLKEFQVYFAPNNCDTQIVITLPGNKGRLEVTLFDCRGKMEFQHFDSTNTLVVHGFYSNSIDTLKKYSIGKSAIDNSKSIKVLKFFQPLPTGQWKYYSQNRKIKNESYQLGILIE